MIELENTIFKNVRVFKLQEIEDYRGKNLEIFNKNYFDAISPKKIEFIRDTCSYSKYSVLRGFHGDFITWKLVKCLRGVLLLTILDIDKNSETYLKYEKYTLSEYNNRQVLIPPTFVNAHICMSDYCIFHYKMDTNYEDTTQFTVKYDFNNITWPLKDVILSSNDSNGPFLQL